MDPHDGQGTSHEPTPTIWPVGFAIGVACIFVGLVISIGQGAPQAVWAFLSLFIAFSGVWTHHRIRFKQLAGASAYPDEGDTD